MAVRKRWNHNLHYQPLILKALPLHCGLVLDVGCGEGMLARDLSARARQVMAIDLDPPTIALARQHAAAQNIDYTVGDFLTHDFEPSSFDAIVSIAAVHHMGTAAALERMRELLKPGGTIAIVGLARSQSPADFAFDIAGAIATRLYQLSRPYWETVAPKLWPPPETYPEVKRIAAGTLPGAAYRRHLLWRYSLVWTKPTTLGMATR